MYSYNNIIEKGAPEHVEVIDNCLNSFSETPHALQHTVANGVDCIVVENFLSCAECDAIRDACEKVGYTFWHQKEHNVNTTEQESDESADNVNAVRIVDTIEADFLNLSRKLYERISSVVDLQPKCFDANMPNADELYERDLQGRWEPCALSRNLLLGRYGPGGHFMPHIDGSTIVDLNTRSFYTLLIYLNDCPDGGETRMFAGEQCRVMMYDECSKTYRGGDEYVVGSVQPKKGSAVFFYYDLLHEASPVKGGLKYICRADLLFRRTPPILTSEKDVKAFELYQRARLAESNGEASEACNMFQKVAKLSPGVASLYQLD